MRLIQGGIDGNEKKHFINKFMKKYNHHNVKTLLLYLHEDIDNQNENKSQAITFPMNNSYLDQPNEQLQKPNCFCFIILVAFYLSSILITKIKNIDILHQKNKRCLDLNTKINDTNQTNHTKFTTYI
tara:strand:+ start:1122 stop:1502 length:381 start_codon:yes stop_codon:yes gene_type:complete